MKININRNRKQIAVLLDPAKISLDDIPSVCSHLNNALPDMVLIGGSGEINNINNFITQLKTKTELPIILFPGNVNQVSLCADGILLLSLISGRNPELLIGQHTRCSVALKRSNLSIIPTGYILIDGGKLSSVEKASGCRGISQSDIETIVSTAVAGELLGMRAIYLEAGSGALIPVSDKVIKAVRQEIDIPLIVGGGLRNKTDIKKALDGGADMVVIGNHFEQNPDDMADFCRFVHYYAK